MKIKLELDLAEIWPSVEGGESLSYEVIESIKYEVTDKLLRHTEDLVETAIHDVVKTRIDNNILDYVDSVVERAIRDDNFLVDRFNSNKSISIEDYIREKMKNEFLTRNMDNLMKRAAVQELGRLK